MDKSNQSESVVNKKKQKKKLYFGNHKLINKSKSPLVIRDSFYNKMMRVLPKHFGFYKIRPLSRRIVSALTVNKQDVCAVLAPGYGKSICYQLPAVLKDGLVLVVTPLIFAVMEQVQRLHMNGLYSCILESSNAKKINELISAKCKILYVPPQLIVSRESVVLEALKNVNIQLIAILEAHCVSLFSHDYRVLYRDLAILKDSFPTVPILALTATPAPKVRMDIIVSLQLKDPLVIYSGSHRPNIYLQVNAKRDDHLIEDILSVIADNDGPTLIYTLSRSQVIELVMKMKGAGITTCKGYYVGQSVDYMNKTYQSFAANQFKILVTTAGGGLIVSKPDIRNVIHCHVPKDIESYYQEIGRAGRDGLKAKCVLFYSQSDMDTHEFLRSSSKLLGLNEKARTRRDSIANILKNYALTKQCRWAFLLKHFDERGEHKSILCNNCCDNCKTGKTPKQDMIEYFLKYLKEVQSLNDQQISYDLNTCVTNIVTTDPAKKSTSLDWWSKIANLAEEHGFVETAKTQKEDTLVLSPKGMQMLATAMTNENNDEVLSHITEEINDELLKLRTLNMHVEPIAEYSIINLNKTTPRYYGNDLLEKLKIERLRLSSEVNCLPYLIASDKALKTLSLKKPCSLKKIIEYRVEGFSYTVINRFGDSFVKIIQAHTEQNAKTEAIAEKDKKETVEVQVKEA